MPRLPALSFTAALGAWCASQAIPPPLRPDSAGVPGRLSHRPDGHYRLPLYREAAQPGLSHWFGHRPGWTRRCGLRPRRADHPVPTGMEAYMVWLWPASRRALYAGCGQRNCAISFRSDPQRRSAILSLTETIRSAPPPSGGRQATAAGRQNLDDLSHDGWQRFGHAWYDVITVAAPPGRETATHPGYLALRRRIRRSLRGLSLVSGDREQIHQCRASAPRGFRAPRVLSSFWTEYHVEVTNLLAQSCTGIQPNNAAGGNP